MMLNKVIAAIRAVLLLAAAALLTAALGVNWADVLAPLNDLGSFTFAGVSIDAGHALAAALVTAIPSGIVAAAAWVTRERRGYGYGIPAASPTPGVDAVDRMAPPPDVPGIDG